MIAIVLSELHSHTLHPRPVIYVSYVCTKHIYTHLRYHSRMADANSVDKPSSTCVLPSAFTASSNAIACDAIAAKLTEVTKIAESLDSILCELQDTLDEARADISSEPAVSRPVAIVPMANNTGGNANNSDVSVARQNGESVTVSYSISLPLLVLPTNRIGVIDPPTTATPPRRNSS